MLRLAVLELVEVQAVAEALVVLFLVGDEDSAAGQPQ